jgi:hypothetical protein
MARMLARTDPYPQSQRHHGECRCDRSALYYTPKGIWQIRKRNRARERRGWRQDARTATDPGPGRSRPTPPPQPTQAPVAGRPGPATPSARSPHQAIDTLRRHSRRLRPGALERKTSSPP